MQPKVVFLSENFFSIIKGFQSLLIFLCLAYFFFMLDNFDICRERGDMSTLVYVGGVVGGVLLSFHANFIGGKCPGGPTLEFSGCSQCCFSRQSFIENYQTV